MYIIYHKQKSNHTVLLLIIYLCSFNSYKSYFFLKSDNKKHNAKNFKIFIRFLIQNQIK